MILKHQQRRDMGFDLVKYARRQRYRTRNLHNGRPVPPARDQSKHSSSVFLGDANRWDAIVGRDGYVAMDGRELSVFAHYRSRLGKTHGLRRLMAAGAIIDQDGETEIGARAPIERIDSILAAIRVSKRRPGNAKPDTSGLLRYQRQYSGSV